MAKLSMYQLTALPTPPYTANSVYFIEHANGNDAELYITDSAGALHNVGNTVMITAIANAAVTAALATQNSVEVFPDIPTRDAATLTSNSLVVVIDASGDPTVTAGSALYVYQSVPDTFDKLSEFESLDIVLDWANIQNKPASPVAQIDDAVSLRHSHANKADLDRMSFDGDDCLLVDGVPVKQPWTGQDW